MMDVNALYNVAKGFVNKLQNEKPAFASEADAAICLIVTDDEEIISGVTGIGIHAGNFVSHPAELVALAAMIAAGKFKARQMIVISMADNSIAVPCEECLEMLMLLDTDNDQCETAVSEDKIVTVGELMAEDDEEETADTSSASIDFFSGFGDADVSGDEAAPAAMFEGGFDESYSAPQHEPVKTEPTGDDSLGEPADYASEVALDESNPFYEPVTEAQETGAEAASTGAPALTEPNMPKQAASSPGAKPLSKTELLKQAKKKKKVAKSNFNFFKKKSQ